MRTLSFKNVQTMGGRRIPTLIECVPLKKEGHQTTIQYHQFEVDVPFDGNAFSLKILQKPLK